MTDREKLVELLESAESAVYWNSGDKSFIEKIADHLIANGVTVHIPKNKPPTDLTGKCGSCVYAEQTVAFGGSRCYVLCTHPERRHVKHVTYPRQRTCKACKMYKPLPEPPKEEENSNESNS